MDSKYIKIIEDLVSELLQKYVAALNATQDEFEYCAVMTAILVFKELAMVEFKKGILKDSEDDPDDICKTIDEKAREIAISIMERSQNDQQTLN